MHEQSHLLSPNRKASEPKEETHKRYYPIDEEAARTAWNMNHMGMFSGDEQEYMQEVDQAYEIAEEVAERCPDQKGAMLEMADKFAKRLAGWYNKKYRIDSMCPSVLIAGPSNFPVSKKEKQSRAADRHWEDYRKIMGVKERIRKLGEPSKVIKAADDDAAKKLREKIAQLTEKQKSMKTANAQARKEGKHAPYAACTLSNNSQRIRATKAKLASLEATKEMGTSERCIEFMGEQVAVIENTELMRLQLLFDGKPSDNIRETLKKNGFRWSPKQGAWQRQLTANARFALRLMLKTAAKASTPEQPPFN